MPIPEKIILCEWEYRVIVEKNPTTKQDVSTVCWGVVDTNEQVIKVNSTATVERAQETILHELFHAIDERLLFGEEALGEKRIIALAHGVRSLIQGNPDLVRFLQEKPD